MKNSKKGANDEFYTPVEAVEMIIPFIPKDVKTIWECTAIKGSKIVQVLRDNGFEVISSHIFDGQDFLKYEPEENYDLIITNPPYSIKDDFLKRAFDLKKPFIFLLPITTLEGLKRSEMFREHDIQLIIPNKRFEFIPDAKNGVCFQTSWFTHGLGLEKDLNFMDLNDRNQQLINKSDEGGSKFDLGDGFKQVA